MKEQIQNLIQEHKQRLSEVFEESSELSKIDGSKLLDEDSSLLRDRLLLLELEYSLRNSFVFELQDLL